VRKKKYFFKVNIVQYNVMLNTYDDPFFKIDIYLIVDFRELC